MSSAALSVGTITPTPTDEELAAIVSALELAWPRPVVVVAAPPTTKASTAWRFSGRSWSEQGRRPR